MARGWRVRKIPTCGANSITKKYRTASPKTMPCRTDWRVYRFERFFANSEPQPNATSQPAMKIIADIR